MKLYDLSKGGTARIVSVSSEDSLRRHLLDLGLIPGAAVRMIGKAPLGDPLELTVQGCALTLRRSEAALIEVEPCESEPERERTRSEVDFGYNLTLHEHNAHPGFGEEGRYHDHTRTARPTRDLRFAIVGQHNSGKTAVFNALTGSNEHVGNYPGVTVERKDGALKGGGTVTDLPGIYSLDTEDEKEKITRDFLVREKPDAILNIVDAGCMERHLYLTVQLIELGIPMVLGLNMMDELRGNGGSVRVNELERELGIPVVPVSASKKEGLDELMEHAVHIAKYSEAPATPHLCSEMDYQNAIDKGLDPYAAKAEMRYAFVNRLCGRTLTKPGESREFKRSQRLDRILTGRWTAFPSFLFIIALVFWLSFDLIGGSLQGLIAIALGKLSSGTETVFGVWGVSPAVTSLVCDAIIGGVGAVVSFIPIILTLFLFLSIMEDSGYMSRVAYSSDTLLRKLGLSGRSIVPMLIGFGCSVPAIMATRTLPSSRDRRRTIQLIPFMSCSAKIAVYGFLSNTFFPGKAGLVMTSLYVLGILVAIAVALCEKVLHRGESTATFVMEMPVYRLPNARNVAHLLWDKTKDFLKTAFTVIFLATIVIWLLQSFDFRFNYVTDSSASILAGLAGLIAPVFAPLGFGDWRIVTALISGFLAKESIVATLNVLGATALLSTSSAIPLLVFCLLYTPCIATIAAVKRELGLGKALWVIVFQCAVAWVCAFAASLIF